MGEKRLSCRCSQGQVDGQGGGSLGGKEWLEVPAMSCNSCQIAGGHLWFVGPFLLLLNRFSSLTWLECVSLNHFPLEGDSKCQCLQVPGR